MKFMRRKDLSVETRIEIALLALFHQGIYGALTRIAQVHNVCRKFVYEQLWAAQYALAVEFSELEPPSLTNPSLDKVVLLLRLEGKCSLQNISNILLTLGVSPCSVGTISARLTAYGQQLSATLQTETAQFVLFLSDELFANRQPILITIEPTSLAILRLELADARTADEWKAHWLEIERNHFYCLGLVSDRGTGLAAGFKALFSELPHGCDLFHDIRGLARVVLVKLEKAAYKAISYEQDRWNVLDSARSDSVITKRIAEYEQAVKACEGAIDLYEEASYLFHEILRLLELFDESGRLREAHTVRDDIQAALDCLSDLPVPALHQEVLIFKDNLEGTLRYWERATQVHHELSEVMPDANALQALCLAWQWDHKSYQAAHGNHRRSCQEEREFWLAYAQARLADKFLSAKTRVFEQLDTIVRSSALVETVNSLIRPYLNTCKGQITQEMLNLIMFYHNHRQFRDGKRKGRAPIEILTGRPLQQHWVELLLAA